MRFCAVQTHTNDWPGLGNTGLLIRLAEQAFEGFRSFLRREETLVFRAEKEATMAGNQSVERKGGNA